MRIYIIEKVSSEHLNWDENIVNVQILELRVFISYKSGLWKCFQGPNSCFVNIGRMRIICYGNN